MGVFLQTAIFHGADEPRARAAMEQAAGRGCKLTPELCRYVQTDLGTQVLLGDGYPETDKLAEELSKAAAGPVLLLYLFDGDDWGYDFFDDGRELDRFRAMPDYFGPAAGGEKQLTAGKPEVLARYFPIEPETAARYLSFCTVEQLACLGDKRPGGDCWQMVDFAARLGYPWPFDADAGAGDEPAMPTLGEILAQNIPPQPVPPEGWSGVFPLNGALPTALDRDYILRLLEEDGLRPFAGMTPLEVLNTQEEKRLSTYHPERDPVCQKLAVLAAFCELWMGDPTGAYYRIYHAIYQPVYGPDRGGSKDVAVLRARGMALPIRSKTHIAIKDLTRLMELDADNRDAYLLCRAYFYGIECKFELARADLAELDQLGGIKRGDTRLCDSAFDPEFLSEPESFFSRQQDRMRQGLERAMKER